MGAFSMGGPSVPYHTTGKLAAESLVRNGFDPGSLDPGYGSEVTWMREALDEERPSGWPRHTRSFFMWPSSSDKWRGGGRVPVLVDPSVLRQRCVVADLAVLEAAINDTYDAEEKRRLARRYWREASIGPLAEVDKVAGRYEEAEIFCEPPVPARALSIME